MRRKEMKAIWNAGCVCKNKGEWVVLGLPHSVYLLLKDRLAYYCSFFSPPRWGLSQRREAYNKSLLYDIEWVKAALVPEAANGGHCFFLGKHFLVSDCLGFILSTSTNTGGHLSSVGPGPRVKLNPLWTVIGRVPFCHSWFNVGKFGKIEEGGKEPGEVLLPTLSLQVYVSWSPGQRQCRGDTTDLAPPDRTLSCLLQCPCGCRFCR